MILEHTHCVPHTLLVEMDPVAEDSPGGIVLPTQQIQESVRVNGFGTVKRVGTGAQRSDGSYSPSFLGVGDKVLVPLSAVNVANSVNIDGKLLHILRISDPVLYWKKKDLDDGEDDRPEERLLLVHNN